MNPPDQNTPAMPPPQLETAPPLEARLHPTPPQPPPQPLQPEPPLPEKPDTKSLFEALLRRPHALMARLADGNHGATGRFVMLTVVSFLLFGVVLGCFAKHQQLWAAPVKITFGLLFSAVICFPSLYIFSTLAGARVSVSQLGTCFAGALALAGLLLLGFVPAVWIFAESTDSFGFMGSLAVGAWIIAVMFALRFLKSVISATGGTQPGPLIIWNTVFLLVTLQMTTSLRPILGHSDHLLTQEKRFFLQHWGITFGDSLAPQVDAKPPATTPEAVTPPPSGTTVPQRGGSSSSDNHRLQAAIPLG